VLQAVRSGQMIDLSARVSEADARTAEDAIRQDEADAAAAEEQRRAQAKLRPLQQDKARRPLPGHLMFCSSGASLLLV
jgi:hypothetical protein